MAVRPVRRGRQQRDLRDAAGREIAPDAPERRGWLLERGAVGRLHAAVEQLLADPGTLAAAVRLLLDRHFTPVLAELICAAGSRIGQELFHGIAGAAPDTA